MICPMKVALMSMAAPGAQRQTVSISLRQRAEQRVGEREQHGQADADEERRVDEAGEQEHAALQHRGQLGLAGGGLEELRAHDADADAGADGAQADDEADAESDVTLNGCDRFHFKSPGRKSKQSNEMTDQ